MAGAIFAIQSLPTGITEPADCAIQSISIKKSVNHSSYRDKGGVTVALIPHKLLTAEVSVELKGKVSLSTVVAGAFTEGTLKQLSAKFTETVEDVPSSSISYKSYASVGGIEEE